MGYTRYWSRTDKPMDEDFVEFCKEVVADCERRGITIRDAWGEGQPILTTERIALNGNAESGLDHESFVLDSETGFNFCKTARKPYDYAVRKILKEAKERGFIKDLHSDTPVERRIMSDKKYLED